MFKILIGIVLGVGASELIRRAELSHELRYLGWSGPHRRDPLTTDPEDDRSPGSRGPF